MSSAVIYVYQGDRIVYVNEAAERITGFTRDELLNKMFWEIAHPDHQDLVRARGRARQRGEAMPTTYEVKLLTRSGDVKWAEVTVRAIELNGKPAAIATFFDITRRRQAEERLKDVRLTLERSLRFTEALLSAVPIPVFYKDVEGRYIGCNRAFSDLMGVSSDEIRGKTAEDLWPDEYASVYRSKDLELINNPATQVYEYKVKDKDGVVRPVIYAKNVFRDEEDRVAGIVGAFIDILERKRSEEALSQAKQQAELYLDLMSHDIINMHQIAMGYLELASEYSADPGQKELIERPMEVLSRCTRLIDNVRTLQKLQGGEIRMSAIDLCRVLSDVQRVYGSVENKTIEFSFHGHEHCYVRANELLYDVFANVVGNAVRHTRDNAHIAVGLDVVTDGGRRYCRVVVEDDGPGISDDLKGKIFNRMIESPSRRKGTGLGLYLVKRLVESYRGRVWMEDRVPGDYARGARFVVLLPALDA